MSTPFVIPVNNTAGDLYQSASCRGIMACDNALHLLQFARAISTRKLHA